MEWIGPLCADPQISQKTLHWIVPPSWTRYSVVLNFFEILFDWINWRTNSNTFFWTEVVRNFCWVHFTTYFLVSQDGRLLDDTSTSPFMPSPGLKHPLANSSLPSHGLGGISSGLSMQNLNNRQVSYLKYLHHTQ